MLRWLGKRSTRFNTSEQVDKAPGVQDDGSLGPPYQGDASTEATHDRSYGFLAAILFVVYMSIAVILYVWRGAYFTPDRWAILLFVTAIALGQWKAFLRDWIPVVLLIFGYEFMRGIAYQIIQERHSNIHLTELIAADRFMFFGHLPTLWLQGKLYQPGVVHWYDALAMVMYIMHFVFPLIFAFILWIGSKERFWYFTITFLLMTYLGFTIYLFYPAAPPWMADQWGVIHGVQLPFDQVFHALVPHQYNNLNMIQIWNDASGDPVAAMPSLHAAYPWITMLFAIKFFGKKGLIFVPYNAALWFAVIYLGQHWVIDIIGGIALASVTFAAMYFVWPRIQQSRLHLIPVKTSLWGRRAVEALRHSLNR
ncbi:MAG: phosphatase PAP2 family protein [Nitrolancea sp.]